MAHFFGPCFQLSSLWAAVPLLKESFCRLHSQSLAIREAPYLQIDALEHNLRFFRDHAHAQISTTSDAKATSDRRTYPTGLNYNTQADLQKSLIDLVPLMMNEQEGNVLWRHLCC